MDTEARNSCSWDLFGRRRGFICRWLRMTGVEYESVLKNNPGFINKASCEEFLRIWAFHNGDYCANYWFKTLMGISNITGADYWYLLSYMQKRYEDCKWLLTFIEDEELIKRVHATCGYLKKGIRITNRYASKSN